MSSDTLVIEDLHVFYGSQEVVHGIDLRVGDGESVAMLGMNGAGKSSILRAISGLVKHTSRRLDFVGSSLGHSRPARVARAGIAHVPEGRHLFSEMTVRDNLYLGGAFRNRQQRNVQLDRVFELFPWLEARLTQHAQTLSGGEQQTLAIGRALMSDPRLLILDEPMAGLAPIVVRSIADVLRRLTQDEGLSVLLVDQSPDNAFEISNRAYLLREGYMVRSGSKEDFAEVWSEMVDLKS